MVNVISPNRPIGGTRVKTIPFRQPMLERVRLDSEKIRSRSVARRELGTRACGGVTETIFYGSDRHLGAKIGKMKEATRRPDRQGVGRVQAQEPDAGLTIALYIGSDV